MYSFIFSLCILLFFILIVFWKAEKNVPQNLSKDSYLQSLNNLRGIFAIEVVIGHVVRYEHTILYPMGKFMICSVAFFFFVSAFGMAVSFEKKKNYVSARFILSKPVYLLVLSIVMFILNMGIDVICANDFSYVASPLLYTYLVKTNWYIWSQIIFYLLFFFSYKYAYKFHILLICVATVLLSVIMYLGGFSEAWVASSFAFPCGLIVGEYFLSIKRFVFSWKGVMTLIILSLFGLSSLLVHTENIISLIFMRNSMCIAVIMILFYSCGFFTFGNHSVARFLNKYSTAIYLSQFIWLEVTELYGCEYITRMLVVLIATFMSATLLHPVIVFIRNTLTGATFAKAFVLSKEEDKGNRLL